MQPLLASLRITAATMALCVAGYVTVVWAFAQTVTPFTANGSLLTDAAGRIVGSQLIAQGFTQPRYFWPRPSAVDYNAAGAGGSNKSPASPAVRDRGAAMVAAHGATADRPLPADLATASGAGLDPHVSEAGALYQADRVARARGLPLPEVERLVRRLAQAPDSALGGLLDGGRIVNVLALNRALDAL